MGGEPLRHGGEVVRLGMGTAGMAERAGTRHQEIAALQAGIERGMGLIDTAEMYAAGEAERLVAEAIAGRRDQVFLVTKACGYNGTIAGLTQACEASLARLGTDHLDLYLLHWRGEHPLADAVEGMHRLVARGLVHRWGVSNFDAQDVQDLIAAGGSDLAANQVLYNLSRRDAELKLMPVLTQNRVSTMAYSPIGQGSLTAHIALAGIGRKHQASPAQIALAWIIRQGVIAIPKASSLAHVENNARAIDIKLDAADLQDLERAFPRPHRAGSLLPF